MCPFCLTTVGLVVAGSVSTGGLAALAVKFSRKNNSTAEVIPNENHSQWKSTPNLDQHEQEPESSPANS
jgi:hypothetical protein